MAKMVQGKININATELLGSIAIFDKDIIKSVEERNQNDFRNNTEIIKRIIEEREKKEKPNMTEEERKALDEYLASTYIVDNFKVVNIENINYLKVNNL